ncbi:hypothetical protein L207DRAFT_472732 [Hyaloscypha variabilis F]|uniref:Zn(2)-C6 fungal-type domain-containing protein n=1 Tax=Hyaloscypha variabilis (strain UAMH 11265 / GT02V1 / F) TaxID=1149755 RepID=A0A2J6QYH8_HYAVF|nr:hypothetical protein L207DRAFT_472732 [Hyaloscypha variabilis F]
MTRIFIPRKGAPKSRGGCLTCKIRRIKCDETRPYCARCTSTGRNCDGYTVRSPGRSPPGTSLAVLSLEDTSRPIPERRSFAFFRDCTLPNLSLHFGSPGWTRLVLQASHSEPAIQHAVAALGAIHEHLENQQKSESEPITHGDNSLDYAAQQFTQALIFLGALLAKSDNRSIELALIGALLCMYYEALQENFETSQVHLENCLLVLQSIIPSEENWLSSTRNSKMQVENDIIQAFAHLDIDTACTIGRRSPSFCIADASLDIPTPFTSITQARQVLYGLNSQLHSFMRSTADAYKTNLNAIPLPTIAESNFLQAQLKEWEVSFAAFLSHPTTKLTRQEQQGANVLSIQNKVAYMKAATCLYADEMVFDEYDLEFEEILCLADYLIYLSNGAKEGRSSGSERKKVVLMFEMGIIEGLFWTAIKCRMYNLRRRAIEILRKVTWQEGVWNAEMMAVVAERYVEMEEEGMEGSELRCGSDGKQVRVPEWLRLHDHGWEMNPKARNVQIRAGRRENGVDGEWTWLREKVTW